MMSICERKGGVCPVEELPTTAVSVLDGCSGFYFKLGPLVISRWRC